MENFYAITINTLGDLWAKFLLVVPNIIVAIVVFLIGLLVAVLVAKIVEKLFKFLLIDKAFEGIGFDKIVGKTGLKLNSGKFLGEIIKWLIIIVFLIAAADILNLQGVSEFLGNVVLYIPNIIVAALILLVGTIFAHFAERLVIRSLKAAQYESYVFIAGIAKWAIFIFAILAALVQLRVAPEMMQILFTGIIAMLTIAGGLAFGLGGQDTAHEILEKLKKDFKKGK